LEKEDSGLGKLLGWLDSDPERAAVEYVRLHRRLTGMFESRGAVSPEECADETLKRVARHLREGKAITTDKPAAYIHGVARYILLEQSSKPAPAELDDVPSHKLIQNDPWQLPDGDEKERRHNCLDECLLELSEESRLLVLEYYAEDKSLKINTRDQIAKRLGIASSVLRNRIFKLRKILRGCVAACLAR
jgi:DNA-directed RNA polymerase specialized sigma24 family protein